MSRIAPSYDFLHPAHSLGEELNVGVMGDSFDRGRGILNVRYYVFDRFDAVKSTARADDTLADNKINCS